MIGRESLEHKDPLIRFLKIFTDIRPGESSKTLLLTLNIYLLLLAYTLIKPLRNALLLTANSAETQSYLGAAQAVLLIFVIKVFSSLASRIARQRLILRVTLFFISNLLLFYAFHVFGMPVRIMGILFFIWIGIFNVLVVSQFWGFANDLYSEEDGKRLFPLIAFGATLGAVSGSGFADLLIGPLGLYPMMLLSAALLGFCAAISMHIHNRELRVCEQPGPECDEIRKVSLRIQEKPLKHGGGFELVFRSRYLLLIALLIGIYNFINATGEYILNDMSRNFARQTILSGAAGGLSMEQIIGKFFADYQFLANLLALVIQLFLVSRIFKWIGIGGALLFLPVLALGGYGTMTFGASLLLVKWVKAVENATDYSVMNTTKAALFLITPREEKYKAKAAIDTFFVRGGDALAALSVFVGTTFFALNVERYALLNTILTGFWIGISVLVMKEYKKISTTAGDP